jgi:hypothetical protein
LVEGKAGPIITVTDALQSLLAVEAVRRSIATGRTVALQDLAPNLFSIDTQERPAS